VCRYAPLYLRETVLRDAGWWGANQPRLLAFHRRLEAALRERDERIARHAGAGGGVQEWEEEEEEEEEEVESA
jgi:hypothetical protein